MKSLPADGLVVGDGLRPQSIEVRSADIEMRAVDDSIITVFECSLKVSRWIAGRLLPAADKVIGIKVASMPGTYLRIKEGP